MKLIFVILVLYFSCTCCFTKSIINDDDDVNQQWQLFKQKFRSENNLVYKTVEEEQYRRRIFETNYRKIVSHNREHTVNGLHTYRKGVNQFTDMTSSEFRAQYTTKLESINKNKLRPYNRTNLKSEDEFDWRNKNVVAQVKNQGQCGSCWAFATVAILESRLAIKSGSLRSLSEQEIIDCTDNYDCDHGGNIQMATETLAQLGGIESDDVYPYTSDVDQCSYDESQKVATVGTNLISVQGEDDMQDALYNNGPLYVSIYVDDDFQSYDSGVFSDDNCDYEANHAVVVVGYGDDSGDQYWLVRNSWGSSWGEEGYVKILRGSNMCQIANEPTWTDDIN